MDCGATCLRIIAKYYGKSIALLKLRRLTETTRAGASMKGIADAAEKIGFRSLGVKISFEKFVKEAPLPCIVHWQQKHFVVVYAINNSQLRIKNWFQKLSIVNSQLSTVHSQLSIQISDPAPLVRACNAYEQSLYSFVFNYSYKDTTFLKFEHK